jgi:hypothetical protein
LAATRREDGSWKIDNAELARYLEANQHRFRSETGEDDQPETDVSTVAELRAWAAPGRSQGSVGRYAAAAGPVESGRNQLGNGRRAVNPALSETQRETHDLVALAAHDPVTAMRRKMFCVEGSTLATNWHRDCVDLSAFYKTTKSEAEIQSEPLTVLGRFHYSFDLPGVFP